MELNGLSNFCRQSPKEHSYIIISKSMHWLRRKSHLKVFLFLTLVAILFNGTEQLSNFSRELPKEPSCKIISKSVHQFSISPLKLFSIYSPGGHFVQQSGTISILEES